MAKFKKEGCQYAQPCWQKQAADERYNSGELARFGTRKPEPWVKANAREISKVFNQAGNLAKKGKPSTSLSRASVVAPSPMRNPGVVGGAPQRYVPPNRRNGPPGGGRGWNNAPRGAPQPAPSGVPQPAPRGAPQPAPRGPPQHAPRGAPQPAPRGPPRNPGSSWNPSSAPAPRNVAPGGPRYGPPGGAPRHLAPTSHVGAPTVNASRSPSSNVAGARNPSIRSSRSNSREPQNTRMPASRAPTMSTPPCISQPPVSSASTQPSGVVISFDSKHIIHDYIVNKLKMAGARPPTKILVEDGRVQVFFSSAVDADLASKTKILYDNGASMQVCLMEKVDESRV